jgi:hypothetical protein
MLYYLPQSNNVLIKRSFDKEIIMEENNIVRCLISLTDKQKDSLDLLARNICRKRVKSSFENEKISSSTIIRCLIDVLMKSWGSLDVENIPNQEILMKRIIDLLLSFQKENL